MAAVDLPEQAMKMHAEFGMCVMSTAVFASGLPWKLPVLTPVELRVCSAVFGHTERNAKPGLRQLLPQFTTAAECINDAGRYLSDNVSGAVGDASPKHTGFLPAGK